MTQTPVQPPLTRRPGRALRVALVVSLMVNVLVIGTLIGGAYRMARVDPAAAGADMRALWRALPGEARGELRQMARAQGLHDDGRDHSERRERASQQNSALIAALRAQPFDSEGFAALLSADRAMEASRLQQAHRAFAAQVARLTPDQRAAMAARFEDNLRERRQR